MSELYSPQNLRIVYVIDAGGRKQFTVQFRLYFLWPIVWGWFDHFNFATLEAAQEAKTRMTLGSRQVVG